MLEPASPMTGLYDVGSFAASSEWQTAALIGVIVVSILMYLGPALGSFFYSSKKDQRLKSSSLAKPPGVDATSESEPPTQQAA